MAWAEKYWIAGGAGAVNGTSEANAWDTATMITSAAAGDRVNMKVSTDANTTTNRTFATAGTTTAPVWFRGYKSTIGDMDVEPSSTRVAGTDIPSITFTTGSCSFSGGHQIWSNINFASARTAGPGFTSATATSTLRFDRCRFENTGANAASTSFTVTTTPCIFSRCWFKATSTATRVVKVDAMGQFHGCAIRGGGIGIDLTTSSVLIIIDSAFLSTGGIGVSVNSSTNMIIDGNSFSSCGGDAIKWVTTLPTGTIHIVKNNTFASTTGYDLNQSTGTNTNFVFRSNNLSYAPSTAHETGFGDSPAFLNQTETSTPFTSSSDLSLVVGALSRAGGFPGRFENETFTGYMSAGGVQLASGGSGPVGKYFHNGNIGTY